MELIGFTVTAKIKIEFNIVDDKPAGGLNENVINSFGMNLVFGFHHSINNRILVGAEFLPYFSYRSGYSKSYTDFESDNPEKKDISGYSYGFSNNSVQINITYRF
ncbi:MAG: hypothetical protein U5L09_05440 [Bacteroidales bacterium]|nr:hypothetical protein [Bacteroidales bacterium]